MVSLVEERTGSKEGERLDERRREEVYVDRLSTATLSLRRQKENGNDK